MAKKKQVSKFYATIATDKLFKLAQSYAFLALGAEELKEIWQERQINIHIDLALEELTKRGFFEQNMNRMTSNKNF